MMNFEQKITSDRFLVLLHPSFAKVDKLLEQLRKELV